MLPELCFEWKYAMRSERRRTGWTYLLSVAALLVGAGCSLRNDPHGNPFTPRRDQLHLTQRTDTGVTAAERGLDNAAQRIDNVID